MADVPQKCKCGWPLPVAVTLVTARVTKGAPLPEARVACPICRTTHRVPVDGEQPRLF